MNSAKKESIAITAIINEVNQYDNLEEELKKRDKVPVWDGDLYLYQRDSRRKSDIVGRIPVQVKGRDAKSNTYQYKKNSYYDIEIVDIESYRKDRRGAIFFVVEIFPDRSTKIYYQVFDLEMIDEILEVTPKGKKTKRIQFKELEKNQLVSICIEFIEKLKIYKSIMPIKEIEVYDKKTICYDHNTKYELNAMKKANEVFYETNAYREAKEKLEKQNIIILHGEPWVGKTSTARKLVMNYIDQGYLFLYGNVDDLVAIKNKVAMDGKIICLLDDFLGSNIQYLEKNVAESTLDKIINIFKNSKEKKLIMTTRTYIYNNSKQLFYKFYRSTGVKDEYLIDVANYNYLEKGNILYNHLEKNNLLGTEKYAQIVQNEFYATIINHENFNPGVINLICERMKDKEITDVRDYIWEALKDPEGLWEEEYQKLTNYEKIILTIIVLFGVKVPIDYVKEQFKQLMKNEKMKWMGEEAFEKALDRLSISFIKVTFDEKQIKQLEVTKHSIADYIISKIKRKQIEVKPYIESAKYIEVLRYISIIVQQDEKIEEQLAQKVEKDLHRICDFFYEKTGILYRILKRRVNPQREKILKDYILQAFECFDIDFIINILEDPEDIFYDFVIEQFEKIIINRNDEEYLFGLRYVTECETYFKTCLEIVNYKKDSEYMMVNFYEVIEMLQEVVSRDIEDTIKDFMMEYVAKDVIAGKNRKKIIDDFIYSVVEDEIPSLQKLYSKKNYQKILNNLYEMCDVYIDEEELEETIEQIKEGKKEIERQNKPYQEKLDGEQQKKIKEKFEGEFFSEDEIEKNELEKIFKDFRFNLPIEIYRKWWLISFIDDDDYEDYKSLKHYYEFTRQEKEIDDSLEGFAKDFLDYLLHQKNKVSKKAENLLKKIAYQTFKKGDFYITNKEITKQEQKYPELMEELYHAEIILSRNSGYCFLNEYLYLYIALKECIRKDDDIMFMAIRWIERKDGCIMLNKIQKILELYETLETQKFNQEYVVPFLEVIIHEIEKQYKKMGKMNVAKAIIHRTSLKIELDFQFELYSSYNDWYLPFWFVTLVTGTKLEEDIGRLDYSIYQNILYQKCYDEKTGNYILDFEKILKDKQLRNICNSLKVWDYLYDIYIACKETVEKLKEDSALNAHHMNQNKIVRKYFV